MLNALRETNRWLAFLTRVRWDETHGPENPTEGRPNPPNDTLIDPPARSIDGLGTEKYGLETPIRIEHLSEQEWFPMATLPIERALVYLDALEADRKAALALSEQKAEEAELIQARQEDFAWRWTSFAAKLLPVMPYRKRTESLLRIASATVRGHPAPRNRGSGAGDGRYLN